MNNVDILTQRVVLVFYTFLNVYACALSIPIRLRHSVKCRTRGNFRTAIRDVS